MFDSSMAATPANAEDFIIIYIFFFSFEVGFRCFLQPAPRDNPENADRFPFLPESLRRVAKKMAKSDLEQQTVGRGPQRGSRALHWFHRIVESYSQQANHAASKAARESSFHPRPAFGANCGGSFPCRHLNWSDGL